MAAYLARFKGQSRIHTESDLRGYVASNVAYDARMKNQYTGYNLLGFGDTIREGSVPQVGDSCRATTRSGHQRDAGRQHRRRSVGELGQEVPNAVDSFGDKDAAKKERKRTIEGREIGQRLIARAGFELLAKGSDRSGETARVTYGSEKSSLTPVMTDAVKRFTPDQQSLWKVFSGATQVKDGWLAGWEVRSKNCSPQS